MVYASYAEGIVPGDINIELVNADEQELAQYVAAFPTLAPALPEEPRPLNWAGSRRSLMALPISTPRLLLRVDGHQGALERRRQRNSHQRTSYRCTGLYLQRCDRHETTSSWLTQI